MESDSTLIESTDSEDNHLDAKDMSFTAKEMYYFRTIDKFIKGLTSKVKKEVVSIIDSKSKISLRQLDWFVTKYADNNIVCIDTVTNDDMGRFDIHISYKAQLKSFKKRYFDPFKRYKKFYYYFNFGDSHIKILTTIGQLNFFRCCLEYGIIEHFRKNYDKLSKIMIELNKNKKNKDKVTKKKTVVKKKGITVTAKRVEKTDKKERLIISFD